MIQGQIFNVVSGYAPQTGWTQEEKDSSHDDLEVLIRNIPSMEHLKVGADMNGHVVLDADGYEGVHGRQGFGSSNEEVERTCKLEETGTRNLVVCRGRADSG